MKYLYIGLLILCLLLSACYLSTRELRRGTAAVLLPLDRAAEAFRSGDRTGALAQVDRASAQWARYEPVFSSLLSHERTALVSDYLLTLRFSDGETFEQTCEQLRSSLRAIVEMELPSLWNIL